MKFRAGAHSLRWRVQILHGLLLAAVLTVLGIAAFLVLLDRFMRDVDNEIYAAGFSVYRQFSNHPALATSALDSTFAEPEQHGLYGLVWNRSGALFWQSINTPSGVPQPTGTGDGFRTRGWRFREYYVPVDSGQWVLAGRSLVPEYWRCARVILLLIGAGGAIWGATMAAGWILIGRALLPIRRIAETAERIAEGDLSQRIAAPEQRSELGRLASVLNSSFTRLEASFARQRRFTADAAHELRTPTAIILAHAQNGRQSPALSAEDRAAFEACERAALRMKRLIEQLLQLARSDAGQQPAFGECDLARVLTESTELLHESATQRGIELQTNLTAVSVKGDPIALGQVVSNLVENAIYYHDKSPGFVRVSLRVDGVNALVEVSDNGPGIAPEHLAHLFERFYRVDKARTGRDGHTGLGLSISEEIVKAHGGSFEVESAVGQGTAFRFTIPIVRRAA